MLIETKIDASRRGSTVSGSAPLGPVTAYSRERKVIGPDHIRLPIVVGIGLKGHLLIRAIEVEGPD
jgi:hypothetical protein